MERALARDIPILSLPPRYAIIYTMGAEDTPLPPGIVIATSIVLSYVSSGLYGIAIAALGMLSFVGATVFLNMASPLTIAGGLVGAVLATYFMALLTENTIDAAVHMADAGDKQLTENPGILDGTAKPDYDSIIKMATRLALKKMLIPSILAIVIPVPCLLLGYEFVGGMLVGSTLVSIPMAIFMDNSGGAFDNAKKYVEEGLLEGYSKGTDTHKTTVIGDTVGDTRKDVVGVALDIFIKMMSTVANTLAPVFSSIHLF